MENKPETVSIFELIKISHKKAIRKAEQRRYRRQRRHGMWYCAYCDKMHSKRVIEYQIAEGLVDSVCSLGRAAYMKHDPEFADEEQYTPSHFRPLVAGEPYEDAPAAPEQERG